MMWLNGNPAKIKQIALLMSKRTRLLLIGFLTLSIILVVAALPRIPQDQEYHQFADQRIIFGLPNFVNVISNAPFVFVGGLSLLFLLWQRATNASFVCIYKRELYPYMVFFCGVMLVGFGSGYYHLSPDNERLVWDRLPMTIVFTSFLASIITERIGVRIGLFFLLSLVLLGASSVIYWSHGEQRGVGDLRPYILVTSYSVLLIPLIVFLYPPGYTRGGDIFIVMAFYALAVLCEISDKRIFDFGQIVSGHTLKHLFAVMAVYWVLRMIQKRQWIVEQKG